MLCAAIHAALLLLDPLSALSVHCWLAILLAGSAPSLHVPTSHAQGGGALNAEATSLSVSVLFTEPLEIRSNRQTGCIV